MIVQMYPRGIFSFQQSLASTHDVLKLLLLPCAGETGMNRGLASVSQYRPMASTLRDHTLALEMHSLLLSQSLLTDSLPKLTPQPPAAILSFGAPATTRRPAVHSCLVSLCYFHSIALHLWWQLGPGAP